MDTESTQDADVHKDDDFEIVSKKSKLTTKEKTTRATTNSNNSPGDRKTELTKDLSARKIDYGSARAEGVKMNPPTKEDYRSIISHLTNQKVPFHTYQTEEEKCLRVVIKGILENISTDEVKEDLTKQGFHPGRIHRMLSSRTDNKGRKMETRNMVVNIPKTEKKHLQLETPCQLVGNG